MKLAIVGTHTISETQENYDLMEDAILATIPSDAMTEIVSGGAKGIDTMAARFAKKFGKKMTIYPAEWHKYGRSAGPMRNQFIIDRADLVIAFPDAQSVGTRDSMKKAKKQNKLKQVWEWETLEREMNEKNRYAE